MLAVWNLDAPVQMARLTGHEGVVLGASFAADGTLWSWGADGTIRTWDVAATLPISVTRLIPPEAASG
jgi:WD40 repeat protein